MNVHDFTRDGLVILKFPNFNLLNLPIEYSEHYMFLIWLMRKFIEHGLDFEFTNFSKSNAGIEVLKISKDDKEIYLVIVMCLEKIEKVEKCVDKVINTLLTLSKFVNNEKMLFMTVVNGSEKYGVKTWSKVNDYVRVNHFIVNLRKLFSDKTKEQINEYNFILGKIKEIEKILQ